MRSENTQASITALCMSTHWPGGFAPNEEIPAVFNAYVKQNIIPSALGRSTSITVLKHSMRCMSPFRTM